MNAQSYQSRIYNLKDGLASATVLDVRQDSRGVMWFATAKGVTSYDGVEWRNYSRADGLLSISYHHLSTDSTGAVWAFSNRLDKGFSRFFNNEWQAVEPPAGGSGPLTITAVAPLEHRGRRFIGIGAKENGFFIYSASGWTHLPLVGPGGSAKIRAVTVGGGKFYLAADTGLWTLHPDQPGSLSRQAVDTPQQDLYGVAVEENPPGTASPVRPRIWLTGRHWTGYYRESAEPGQRQFHLLHGGKFPGFPVGLYYKLYATTPDRRGGIWICCDNGIIKVSADGGVKTFGKRNGLTGNGAYAIFYDREANIWFGDFRGVSKITSFRFANYRKQQGLREDEVTALLETGENRMIFGHNRGFTFMVDGTFETLAFPPLSPDITTTRVMDFDMDRRGNIWAAVARRGIVKITPDRRMIWYAVDEQQHGTRVYSSVRITPDGTLWAAVDDKLLRLQNNRLVSVPLGTSVNHIRRLFKGPVDAGGNWETLDLATAGDGLLRLSLKSFELTRVPAPDEEGVDNTYSVYTDRAGRTWVGAVAGLYQVVDGRMVNAAGAGLTTNSPVYFIIEDRAHSLWLGMDNGVVRWDPETGTGRHFTTRDGLVGHETNRAAGLVDSSGRIWIGAVEGVSRYFEEHDTIRRIPPLVELLYMESPGLRHSLDRPLTLDHQQNDLTFHFRGVSFIDETATTYHIKLDGYDSSWLRNFKAPNHRIRYTHIPPGRYVFNIVTVNSAGIESRTVSSAEIVITPPFWRTPWFYLLVLLGIVGLAFYTSRYISGMRHAQQLETQVRERTRELEESQNYFSSIFENAHDAIIIFLEDDEVVLDVNQRACQMYGYDRSEFIGMSLKSISKDVSQGTQMVKKTMTTGSSLNFETEQYRKDGSVMHLEINSSVILFRGREVILSINRDITRRMQVDAQIRDSLKEKEVLLKEIHHRVKNNLQVITSLLDLQSDAIESEQVQRVFRDSKSRIRSMALIHERLYESEDLSRIDMPDYIQALTGYLWDVYGNITLPVTPIQEVDNISLNIDTAIPIGLILTELFSNSLKYAFPTGDAFPTGKEGEIRIHLSCSDCGRCTGKTAGKEETGAPRETLTLSFRDNGVGFPTETDMEHTQNLGLQLVRILVQQIGGTLTFDGQNGASFTILFPCPNSAKNSAQMKE